MANIQKTEIAIIGAGPGGYPAAFLAADLGFKVTLIDTGENPGGVCLFRGCIPSKTLLHIAKVFNEASLAKEFGVDFASPHIDLEKLRAWKNRVVSKLTGGLGVLCKQRKINFIRGKAKFINSQTIKIQKNDSTSIEITFTHAIVASGSSAIRLPFAPPSKYVMDSTSALEVKDIPKKLLVIGGGYIGLELGSVYKALGSNVTVVEMLPSLLQGVDRDLVIILEKTLKKFFSEIKLKTKVLAIEENPEGVTVTFENESGQQSRDSYDKILVAIGRRPNTEGLGLENTRVTIDEKGFVKVNAQRKTDDPAIYAIGDITGQPMLAHKATHEGKVAIEAIAGKKTAFEPKAIPTVIFTDPEIAYCGLTETKAKNKGLSIKIAKFPWAASGRAITLNRPDGLTKLIINKETNRLLGVGICGAGAGELISEAVLAIEMGAVAEDLQLSIHPHPTLSETIMEAALAADNLSPHTLGIKKGAK